jgi:hypothetical protein
VRGSVAVSRVGAVIRRRSYWHGGYAGTRLKARQRKETDHGHYIPRTTVRAVNKTSVAMRTLKVNTSQERPLLGLHSAALNVNAVSSVAQK